MIAPVYALYVCCVGFIRIFKWFEYQLLRLFPSGIKKVCNAMERKVGLVIHRPGEQWTEADNKARLAECKYDKLIHLKVHDEDVFARWGNLGSLGFGETYMDKLWDYVDDVEDMTEMTVRVMDRKFLQRFNVGWNKFFAWLELYAFNLQTRERAFQVGVVHYDLGKYCGYRGELYNVKWWDRHRKLSI